MADKLFNIQDADGTSLAVRVRRDKRLKKSARWTRERLDDGSEEVLLRIPLRMPNSYISDLLTDIEKQIHKPVELGKRRTDEDLQQRAEEINRKHFKGAIQWNAIRWVSNMNSRLGSCTNGGPTDGHIRISEKIKTWPDWVVDYVIAHELAHRVHANHSKAFWSYLEEAYPLTERARGFIQGIGFAQGQPITEDTD
ncbi:MAG: M48 family metallopeptidase [Chloroflexi bacterium]|nr:M48 family metallopeptidase [Chloroflexota bacterium]